jgi:hypothetical protein
MRHWVRRTPGGVSLLYMGFAATQIESLYGLMRSEATHARFVLDVYILLRSSMRGSEKCALFLCASRFVEVVGDQQCECLVRTMDRPAPAGSGGNWVYCSRQDVWSGWWACSGIACA